MCKNNAFFDFYDSDRFNFAWMNQSLMRILGTMYSFLVVFLLFSRCTLPEVKEQERGFITIASDFLEKKDPDFYRFPGK